MGASSMECRNDRCTKGWIHATCTRFHHNPGPTNPSIPSSCTSHPRVWSPPSAAEFQPGGAAPAPAPSAKPSTSTDKAAPAPAPASAPVADGPGAETAQLIVAKGEEIRKLKADKADKAALEVRLAQREGVMSVRWSAACT